MFDSIVLDVAIGLGFVYLLLALICTTVTEYISGVRKLRPRTLRRGIERMLSLGGKPRLAEEFYNHPVIRGLASERRDPSYIPGQTFATVLLDLVKQRGGLEKVDDPEVKRVLSLMLEGVEKDAEKAKKLEQWYDHTMDRVSGWYRRSAQATTLVVAFAITIVANADTLDIARRLWTTPALRALVVERAKARQAELAPALQLEYSNPEEPVPSEPPQEGQGEEKALLVTQEDLDFLGNLMGWSGELKKLETEIQKQPGKFATAVRGWLGNVLGDHLVGWTLTALAVSLGAPFWFDTLNRIIKLRTSGGALEAKKQEKKPKTGAKKGKKKEKEEDEEEDEEES